MPRLFEFGAARPYERPPPEEGLSGEDTSDHLEHKILNESRLLRKRYLKKPIEEWRGLIEKHTVDYNRVKNHILNVHLQIIEGEEE